jgi:molybdopterin molybdotransferase
MEWPASTIHCMSSELLSYGQAAAVVAGYAAKLAERRPRTERVGLGQGLGRVLAQPVCADRDQPPFPRSSRDGYACRAAEVSTGVLVPIAGATRAGDPPPGPLPPGAVWEIMTGAPVPEGADAVVMVEHVSAGGGCVRLLPSRVVKPGEHVVPQGAEARAGDELLLEGTRLGPAQIALAAAFGYASIEVFRKPRVAILATGDELVGVEATPGPGQIRNSNAPMLAAFAAAAGAEPVVLPIAADSAEALDAALAHAADADLLVISGGVSAGKFDLVEEALARIGARFHFTGVRMQPGKPVVFGELLRRAEGGPETRTQAFFGLPGNPVSSAVTFLLFAAPVLETLAGSRERRPRFAPARLAADWRGKPGLTRFLPARSDSRAEGGQVPEVALVPWRGSGDLAAFARSDCFLVVPEEADRLEAGALVRILVS